MNKFWRLSNFQHFQNVLDLKRISTVLFITFLLNQSILPTKAAVALSKREINRTDDGFINVINATTEHPTLFNEKNVINITNKLNSSPLQSKSSITATEQHDNQIPKEFGSHEIDDQIEATSVERNAESATGQVDVSTLQSANVKADRRIDDDEKLGSTSSTISSSYSSISGNTKDISHTVVDHRLPLISSINSTSTLTTTTEPIEKVLTTTTPTPSTQIVTAAAILSPAAPNSTTSSIMTTTKTTLRIKSEDILELSTRNPIKITEIQTSTPRNVASQPITTELFNPLLKEFELRQNALSEQSSELNHASEQSIVPNRTNSLNVQHFDNNNRNNIKDEKNNNSESRANIQFQKNVDPIRNQTTSSEPLSNPEIVTEKRAKYLVDHSVIATLTTPIPLSETWSSLKTVGEVNHNNVSFARNSDAEDPLKKLADWAEIYQDNDDANHTLLSVPNTTQKTIYETTSNLHNQDLKINSSRIDEIGHQDNYLTSEHITTTPNARANATTERNAVPISTQKSANIQQVSPKDTNVITSTTVRNQAIKLVLPKTVTFEQTLVSDAERTDTDEDVITTTDKVDETTLFDLVTTINTPIAQTETSVTEKVNRSQAIIAKEIPTTVHTTARTALPETTIGERHQEETTIFTEFYTTSTVFEETTTDTNDIPMLLPTHRVPMYQKPTERIINFDSSLEKDVTNKQIPITTEKETIHFSPTPQSTTVKEPDHKFSTIYPVHHQPSSTPSDIASFEKINPSRPTDSVKNHTDDESTTIADVSPEIPDGIGDEYLKGEETDYNTIIAISVSCVGLIALILLITFLIIMRKRQKQLTYGQRCRPVGLDAYSLDNISVYNSVRRKSVLRSSKRAYGNAAFDDPALKNNLLTVSQLATYAKKRTAIFDEFKDVPPVTARIDEVPAGCEDKNRYANIVPLPESRVHLKRIGDDEKTEYINANFVKGPKDTTHYYIACQAPLENTIIDFWRMMWEQNSRVIIMATDLTEKGNEKCAEYLPPSFVIDNHVVFGDYQVTLKNREVHEKYAVSMCHLKNLVTNTWREITHFWYQWPEDGVPTEEASVIAMLLEARSYLKMVTAEQTNGDLQESSNNDIKTGNGNLDKNKSLQKVQGPLTVHCSPGTGRTGTVIACDIAIRALEQPSRSVDIPQIVYCVRRGRASAVQTREQYEFIYKVAHMYATKLMGPINDN